MNPAITLDARTLEPVPIDAQLPPYDEAVPLAEPRIDIDKYPRPKGRTWRVYMHLIDDPNFGYVYEFAGTDDNGRDAQDQAHHWVNQHDARTINANVFYGYQNPKTGELEWILTSTYHGFTS